MNSGRNIPATYRRKRAAECSKEDLSAPRHQFTSFWVWRLGWLLEAEASSHTFVINDENLE